MSTTSLSSGPTIDSYVPKSGTSSSAFLSDTELTELYLWVDTLPLSRPKKNFTRDFSDACLLAEVIHSFYPKWVDLHNYPPANSTTQKVYNWNTLNFKVLRKLGCCLNEETIHQIVHCKPGVVEKILYDVKKKTERKSSDSRSNVSISSSHSTLNRPSVYNSEYIREDEGTVVTLQQTIAMLQEKIEKLEFLLKLKDQKIDELLQHYST